MGELVVKEKSEIVTSKFFTFNQNNSGGSFTLDEDRGITHYVIIEAFSAEDANRRAEDIGLYFDGDGDCPCCGDRWYEQWGDEKGTDRPEIYGEPADSYIASFTWMPPGKEIVIHYLDKRVDWHGVFKTIR